jgi:hypothetical protein
MHGARSTYRYVLNWLQGGYKSFQYSQYLQVAYQACVYQAGMTKDRSTVIKPGTVNIEDICKCRVSKKVGAKNNKTGMPILDEGLGMQDEV